MIAAVPVLADRQFSRRNHEGAFPAEPEREFKIRVAVKAGPIRISRVE